MAYVFDPVLREETILENIKKLKKFNAEYDKRYDALIKKNFFKGSNLSPEEQKEIKDKFFKDRKERGEVNRRVMKDDIQNSLKHLEKTFNIIIRTEHQRDLEVLAKKRSRFEYLLEESERKYPSLKLGLGKDKAEAKKENANARNLRMEKIKKSISSEEKDLGFLTSDEKRDKRYRMEDLKAEKGAEKERAGKIHVSYKTNYPDGLLPQTKIRLKKELEENKEETKKEIDFINWKYQGKEKRRNWKIDESELKINRLQFDYNQEKEEGKKVIYLSKLAREKSKELAGKKRQEKVLARTQRSTSKLNHSVSKPAQKLLPEKTTRGETKKFLETKKFELKKPNSSPPINVKAKSKVKESSASEHKFSAETEYWSKYNRDLNKKKKSTEPPKKKPSQKLIPAKTSQSKTGKFLETKKFELKKPTHTTIKAKIKSIPTSKTKDKVVFDWDKPKDKLVFEKRQAKPAQKLISLKTKAKPAQKLISLKTKAKPTQKLLPEKTVRGETKKFLETKKFELKKPSSPTIKAKTKPVPYGTYSGPDEDGFDIIKVLREEAKVREQKEKAILDKKEKLKKAKEARDFKYFMTGIGRKPAKPKKPTIPRERKGTSPVPDIVRMSDAHYAKTLGWGAYRKKK